MVAKAFISYSHTDAKMLDRLHKHLAVLQRDGTLPTWTDHQIVPGDRLNDAISAQLEQSSLFVALVSPDYLASHYCYEKEFKRALELFLLEGVMYFRSGLIHVGGHDDCAQAVSL